MLVILTLCGSLSLEGTLWSFSSVYRGTEGASGYADCTIFFDADSFTVTNGEHSGSGDYELDNMDDIVCLNVDGEILTGYISGDVLTINIGDETVFSQ